MSFLRLISAASGALLAITPAVAADDPAIRADQPIAEYVPAQSASPWYARGDLSYNFSIRSQGGFDWSRFNPPTGVYSVESSERTSFDGGFGGGFGLGYSFTDYLRADVTVDMLRASSDSTTASALACTSAPAFTESGCRWENSAHVTAYSIMANAYADLGTYAGFTPYIGAGLGVAYVDWGAINSSAFCTGATCPPGNTPLASRFDGAGDWRFAWSVMAGIAYDITPRLKADFGYRLRDIGGGGMAVFDQVAQASGATGMQGRDHGFSSHEFRIGLRYALW